MIDGELGADLGGEMGGYHVLIEEAEMNAC